MLIDFDRLSAALGVSVAPDSARSLGGGSVGDVVVVSAGAGEIVVKTAAPSEGGRFVAEAAGLRAMRAATSVLRIPEVFAADDGDDGGFLAMEYVGSGRPSSDFDARVGRGLAEMHGVSEARGFGFDVDTYCGLTLQPNDWSSSWVEFYGQRRLGALLPAARSRGLSASVVSSLESLIARLGEWVAEPGASSLIHGDLWSGNLLADGNGAPVLIDPAASFSHREAELGMMSLFGGFGPDVWAAYNDAWPLAPGWRNRLALYELFHALNHFVLFGGSYAASVRERAGRYAG